MHRPSISNLVFRHLYPSPKNNDPTCFAMHLTRNLIPEVRAETSTFYGTLDTIEARYPGLDYTHAPHRMRLGRFMYHRRLFRAFDELGLTKEEIWGLCRWEGTRWARESFEKQEGVKVRDTTGDEVAPWVPRSHRSSTEQAPAVQVPGAGRRPVGVIGDGAEDQGFSYDDAVTTEDDDEDAIEDAIEAAQEAGVTAAVATTDGTHDESDGEAEVESVGIELNRRLNAAAEARAQGNNNVVMDEAYEQWLKEATERGFAAWPGPLRDRSRERQQQMLQQRYHQHFHQFQPSSQRNQPRSQPRSQPWSQQRSQPRSQPGSQARQSQNHHQQQQQRSSNRGATASRSRTGL